MDDDFDEDEEIAQGLKNFMIGDLAKVKPSTTLHTRRGHEGVVVKVGPRTVELTFPVGDRNGKFNASFYPWNVENLTPAEDIDEAIASIMRRETP